MISLITVSSGIHPHAKENMKEFCSPDEYKILNQLGQEFYISTLKYIRIGSSTYNYAFIKFPDLKSKVFGIENEMIFLLSGFENFEPRTIDAIENILNENSGFRLDKICTFIASNDIDFISKIDTLIQSNNESSVIIPFTYHELLSQQNSNFFIERIKKYFFERNLFDFESPLRKDTYFFARENICHELVDAHISNTNAGIFGLRRSGKTSILFSIKRILKKRNAYATIIDCQKLHLNRWWRALYYIIHTINKEHTIKMQIDIEKYTEENAAMQFENDISKLNRKINKNNAKILLIFDEIEHLTFGISISQYWKTGDDYIKFWQVLRGLYQKLDNPITFLIAGTNPKCIETPFINKVDNPLYHQIKCRYIESFQVDQTKVMVKTLANYMGITFEEETYTYLTREYGGHPFLIRQACSYIWSELRKQNFTKVDRSIYADYTQRFNESIGHKYCEMIIGVLEEYYNDEYMMLTYLARNDIDEFNYFAKNDPTYTEHLLGYSILEKSLIGYDFKMDILKKYLEKKNQYQKQNLTDEEKRTEIGSRRNAIEIKLRKVVIQQLKARFGDTEAKNKVLKITNPKNKTLLLKELFDPDKNDIYLSNLIEIIRLNWIDCFQNIFETDVEKFKSRMTILNSIGRSDAHAKNVKDYDMQSFRGSMTWLEERVDSFLD
ncbi:MAG: hypothetical protein PHQ90_00545 [Sulfuricurvum sp.]|uniref:hypothetical protein n=1 Tax=Sulfuricurvum sp. TaxID=2025608 RepID=UPI00261FDA09|nr:hypothetical protein [Sulfuricurvum sp.]MDD2367754.1 hypothetical protein [Sulfuricurvum sp.]MDD5117332.1 hypothetical protein [Sulfuricurvum sp.]